MEKALQEKGWYLSSDGIERCKEGMDQPLVDNIIKAALDIDLREIGSPALQELIQRGKNDYLTGPLVLQIQKTRNVSAPKANEKSQHAPQLLRLYVTDGCGNLSILQGKNWNGLKMFDKPPGTKIFVKAGMHNLKGPLLPLDSNDFTVLGGKVEALIEKWKIKMSMSHRIRSACGEVGPPVWVPFGQKIDYNLSLHKGSKSSFKSLDSSVEKENVKEMEAFNEQRKATIAEISKSKENSKKVFGKGKAEINKPAEYRKYDNRANNDDTRESNSERKPKSNYRRERTERGDEDGSQAAPSKPSTIFDFLETKLNDVVPSISHNSTKEPMKKPQRSSEEYQPYESSFKFEKDGYSRNPRGGGGGGRFRNEGGNFSDRDNRKGGRGRGGDGGYNDRGNRNASERYSNTNSYGGSNNRRGGGGGGDYDQRRGANKDGLNYRDHPRGAASGNMYEKSAYSQRSGGSNAPHTQRNLHNNNNNDSCLQPNPINFPELGSDIAKHGVTTVVPRTTNNFQGNNAYRQAEAAVASKPMKAFAVGDQVMARYWEDRKFYNATIFATGEKNTCVVQFTEYGNYEEVLIDDVFYAGGSSNQTRESTAKRGSNQGNSFDVPSTDHRQSSQQPFHQHQHQHQSSYGGYHNPNRRANNQGQAGYYNNPHSDDQYGDDGQQAASGGNSRNKSRTYKPSLQYYQPPRQRPQ